MEILPINSGNLNEYVDIFIKAYNAPPWNCGWTQEKAYQYLSEYTVSPFFAGFGLYDDEQLVGATFAHIKTWWTSRQLVIDEFFIAPEKQGIGYGKKLMEYCNIYAKQNGIEILFLMTNKNMPAYKFYNRLDYIPVDQFSFMFKQVT